MAALAKLLCFALVVAAGVYLADGVAVMSIDFSSEFIKVAIVKPGVPMEIALNKESRRKTANILSMRDGERLFGGPALNMGVRFPKLAFRFLLHILGEKFDSPPVNQYRERFPHHKLVKDEVRDTVCFQYSDEERYCVEELVAMMLNNSRETAESFAEQPVNTAVITVPAFFSQAQRRAMIYSAELVGINVKQLMNSGTAVGLNYGVFRQSSFNTTEQNIMFFDMGSTSTIATIVSYQTVKSKELGIMETVPQLTVKSVGFDRTLGGLEMDLRLQSHLADVFDGQKKSPDSVRTSPRAMAKLLKEANRVKQVLSANNDHMAQIEGLLPDIDFRAKVTREELENMCSDLFDRVKAPIEQALKAAEMEASDLQQVIIVGGASRVPKVQQFLLEATKVTELGKSVNSDEAAALGASYAAAGLSKAFRIKKFKIRDLSFYPIEVAYDRAVESGEVKHVERSLYSSKNPTPQKKAMSFSQFKEDFEFSLQLGDMSHLSKSQASQLGAQGLLRISVGDVTASFEKYNSDKYEAKGVKVHFNLDASNLLSVDSAEAVFQLHENQTQDEASTLSNLVDGISNFFSPGAKSGDEKPGDKEDKDAEKDKPASDEQQKTSSSTDDNVNTVNATSNGTASGNDTVVNGTKTDGNSTKPKAPQPQVIRIPLKLTIERQDMIDPSEETSAAMKKRLQDMADRDLAKALLEASKNALEAYIFDMQDKMYSDTYQEVSEEEERTNVTTALSGASDWLYEQGDDTTRELYDDKLAELKALAKKIVRRVKENEDRPGIIKQLRSSLNVSRFFIHDAWNYTKPEEGFVNSIYTAAEVTAFEKLVNETEEWLNETEAKQKAAKKSADPVLTVRDMASKGIKLNDEIGTLSGKAKYYVPKKKTEPKTSKSNSTSNSTDGEQAADGETKSEPKTDSETSSDESSSKQKTEEKSDSKKKKTSSSDDEKPADHDHKEL